MAGEFESTTSEQKKAYPRKRGFRKYGPPLNPLRHTKQGFPRGKAGRGGGPPPPVSSGTLDLRRKVDSSDLAEALTKAKGRILSR